jgi:hypothetical protein
MAFSPQFPKYLPYTTFVCSCVYYTNIFAIEYWKREIEENADATFRSVVERSAASSCYPGFPPQAKDNLLYLAAKVDALEDTLSKNNLRRDDFGLGRKRAKPVHALPASTVRPFFITILLDRILWGSADEFRLPSMSAYVHPHILESDLDRPTTIQKYTRLKDSGQLTDILTRFGVDVKLSLVNPLPVLRAFAQSPPIPIPSTATTPGQDGALSTANVYVPGNLPTLKEPMHYQSSLIAQSANMRSLRNICQAGANIVYLASSAFFLINVCFAIMLIIVD